ncbi:conserved hypothetical protein [Ricinus communis]|uniref:Uncharacterized protein n=1 Tax=Ricinus communis TaxID=3988 RepID=B9S890_RICCO|nr:conserved hypothetical protein [Ricinus communis]
MASQNTNGSYNSVNYMATPRCRHGLTDLLTSWSLDNPFWRFFKCPLRQTTSDYNFFRWIEGPYNGMVKEMLIDLLTKKKYLEETLKIQTHQNDLLEKKLEFNEEEHHAISVELEKDFEK